MQKDFKNWECAHCKEKIPVGPIFGFMFLKFPPVSFLGNVLVRLTHRVIR